MPRAEESDGYFCCAVSRLDFCAIGIFARRIGKFFLARQLVGQKGVHAQKRERLNWRFSLNKPPVLLGEVKNTLVNKNLCVIISEGLATASLKITGGF